MGKLSSLILLFLLTGAVIPLSSYAQISEADCGGPFDNSDHFGETRKDNIGKGICWAFATAGLFEEELCLRDPQTCKKTSLSVLDVTRVHYDFNSGYSADAVYYVLQQGGLCPEEYAPFNKMSKEAFNKKLEQKYMKLRNEYDLSCTEDFNEFIMDSRFTKSVQDILKMLPENQNNDQKIFSGLVANDQDLNFAARMMIPDACKEKRIPFKGSEHRYTELDKKNPKGTIKTFANIFKTGHSAAISICSQAYLKDQGNEEANNFYKHLGLGFIHFGGKKKDKPDGESCADHAVIANGLRWNANKKECQVHLRNSWGKGAPLNDWVNADKFLPYVEDATWMTSSKSKVN